jgi:Domain of unknown function (DUF4437)
MMQNRPHIEFVQAQMLPWRRIGAGLARPDAEYKMLSQDRVSGACSALMRYPRGWRREGPEHIAAAEELYVLDGALEIDGQVLARDCYAYLPASWTRTHMAAPDGCVVLAFYDREPDLVAGKGECSTGASVLDAAAMPWDMTLNDPNLRHLGISRKNLRTDAESGERTFLSLILPQSAPADGEGPQELHPVVEEAFLLAGSLAGPQGVMHPGAYFWRPPMIAHGPFGAQWGAVSLIRFVGGRHQNIWTEAKAPFDMHPPYLPVLPPELAHLSGQEWAPPPSY